MLDMPSFELKASAAWYSLPMDARYVWLALERRFKVGENQIWMSARDAARVTSTNISQETARRCLNDLEDRGFIQKVVPPSGSNPTGWWLTHEPRNGQAATNEWRDWPQNRR